MTTIPETLLAAGYRFYDDRKQRPECAPYYQGLYQKRVRDSATYDTRYFINVSHWVFPSPTDEQGEVEIHLITDQDRGFRISTGFTDLRDTEEFCETAFTRFNCRNYD